MFAVKINMRGAAEILKMIPAVADFTSEDFVARAALFIHRRARQLVPVDTGRLKSDIRMITNLRGIASTASVFTELPYAPYVEEGTKPHFPPPLALEGWVRRHGLGAKFAGRKTSTANLDRQAAFVIARSIAKKGTKPQPFMEPAADELEADSGKRLVESFNRAKARLNQ